MQHTRRKNAIQKMYSKAATYIESAACETVLYNGAIMVPPSQQVCSYRHKTCPSSSPFRAFRVDVTRTIKAITIDNYSVSFGHGTFLKKFQR
jgi:hypothetical protein